MSFISHKYDYRFLNNSNTTQQLNTDTSYSSNSLDIPKLKQQIKSIEQKLKNRQYPVMSTSPIQKPFKYKLQPLKQLPYNVMASKDAYWQKNTIKQTIYPEEFTPEPLHIPQFEPSFEYQLQPKRLNFKLSDYRKVQDQVEQKVKKKRPTLKRQKRVKFMDEFYQTFHELTGTEESHRLMTRNQKQVTKNKLISLLQKKIREIDLNDTSIVNSSALDDQTGQNNLSEFLDEQPGNKFKKIRIALIQYLNKLRRLEITPKQVMNHKIFSKHPHEKENSLEFFQAIKMDDEKSVQDLLKKTPYLVYDYDNALMTGLHWAAKRGKFSIVKILLNYNSDVDALDLVSRTPLYLAVDYGYGHSKSGDNQQQYFQIIQLLLFKQSDPWSNQINSYIDALAKNPGLKALFDASRWLHIRLMMFQPMLRNEIWIREAQILNYMKDHIPIQKKIDRVISDQVQMASHLDPRLQQYYNVFLTYQVRKKNNDKLVQSELQRRVEKDLQIFKLTTKQQNK